MRIALAVTLLLVAARLPAAAHADDAPPTFAELVVLYEAAEKARDVPEQVRLLGVLTQRAAAATAAPGDLPQLKIVADDRRAAHRLARKALSHSQALVIIAGLDGYGTLAIAGSAAEFRHFANRQLSERRPQAVRLAAIRAWAAIHQPGTHDLLLDYLRLPSLTREGQELALAACDGLKAFKALPRGRLRFELLSDFMAIFDGIRNAGTGAIVTSSASFEWFALLHAPLVVAFNNLTDQNLLSHAQVADWWRRHRRAVQAGAA